MPLIIPPSSLERLIYTMGEDYNVNDLIELKGIHYRVNTAIVNAPLYADYDNLTPIGLGMGHATFREYNTNIGVDNWLRICDIPPYFSGSVNVGGVFPAKQISLDMSVNTSWRDATIKGDWASFVGGSIQEVRLTQPANGNHWQLWLNVAQESNLWQMHMVAQGSGEIPIQVSNNATATGTAPAVGASEYNYVIPADITGSFPPVYRTVMAGRHWSSLNDFTIGASALLFYTDPTWRNFTSDSTVLELEDSSITVRKAGVVTFQFSAYAVNGRQANLALNGVNFQLGATVPADNFYTITSVTEVVAGDLLQVRNPGTGGSTWDRAVFSATWTQN